MLNCGNFSQVASVPMPATATCGLGLPRAGAESKSKEPGFSFQRVYEGYIGSGKENGNHNLGV